jgi:hypothetical protein
MRHTLIATIVLLALPGCASNDGPIPTYITATVAGSHWTGPASEGMVVYTPDAPDGPGFIYSIASHPATGGVEYLAIDLPNGATTGSFPLDGLTATAAFAFCPGPQQADCSAWKPVGGHPGTLTITRFEAETGLIEGTFSFTGYLAGDSTAATKTITNGLFSIVAPLVANPG